MPDDIKKIIDFFDSIEKEYQFIITYYEYEDISSESYDTYEEAIYAGKLFMKHSRSTYDHYIITLSVDIE